jgi:uncharacterized protein (TIGR02453 family)
MAGNYFTPDTFQFLTALASHNERPWFEEHKQDYETFVRGPAYSFISDMADDLAAISPHFVASARPVGGSLMRIHRDVRFGHDKSPYKTNIGIQFRHELGKDVHAPGFYVHIEPEACFLGVGLWHPDATALGKIRDALADKPKAWLKVRDDKAFQRNFALSGDSLATAPRGYARDHPLIEDLKRKDFIGLADLSDADVLAKKFRRTVVDQFKGSQPFMRFLCEALGLAY